LVTLELIAESLVRLTDELGLVPNSLQEGVIDLILDIVLVILRLLALVLFEQSLHLLFQLVLLLVKVLHNVLILLLLLLVYGLILSELLSEASQLLDLWSELLLLVLDFILNLLDDLSDLNESLVLLVVEHLVVLRDHLQLVLHIGVATDALGSLKALHEVIQVVSSALQYVLRSKEHSDFSLDLPDDLLHLLVLGILSPQVGCVLLEVVSLHVLASSGLGVVSLLVVHELLQSHLLSLKFAHLVELLLFLLRDGGGLGLVDGKLVVSRGVLSDLVIEQLALSLESLGVAGESLQLGLSGDWLLQDHLDPLQTLRLVVELSPEDVVA
jgi:hypothetical protein